MHAALFVDFERIRVQKRTRVYVLPDGSVHDVARSRKYHPSMLWKYAPAVWSEVWAHDPTRGTIVILIVPKYQPSLGIVSCSS